MGSANPRSAEGRDGDFPPLAYVNEGEHVGLKVDLFGGGGKELGVKVTWVALPWEGVLPGLTVKRFDMVADPATITKMRMEQYAFSSPISVANTDLVKRKGDASTNWPQDVAGKVVLAAIKDLAPEGMTMVVVSHEIGLVVSAAQRVAFLDRGRIVLDGTRPTSSGNRVLHASSSSSRPTSTGMRAGC